jgi:hypothetical protein
MLPGEESQNATPTCEPNPMSTDSSKETKQQQEKRLLNNLLNKHTTITLVKSFSAPLEKADVLKKFCEIAKREAGPRGFSEVIIKAIEEYIKNHEQGNPQLKLTPYIDENATSPVLVLCNYMDGAGSNGKIHCRKSGIWIKGLRCYPCKHNRLNNKP